MAENKAKTNLENSKSSIPSNEELINSIVSSFEEDCSLTEKSVLNNICNKIENENQTSCDDSANGKGCNMKLPNQSEKISSVLEDDEPTIVEEEEIPSHEDDLVDELAMKDLELTYTEEDKERLRIEADVFKQSGNTLFKSGQYKESALAYTQALRTCPLAFEKERAIFYSNRAAAKMKLDLNEAAICDCTKALELDERYLKVLYRRAQLYEATDKLDEALADYNKMLTIDPLHREAIYASKRLPDQIQERNEKLKTEMLGKLKDLGNMVLKPFGLSTENFQLNQDPNSGGYSINFKN